MELSAVAIYMFRTDSRNVDDFFSTQHRDIFSLRERIVHDMALSKMAGHKPLHHA